MGNNVKQNVSDRAIHYFCQLTTLFQEHGRECAILKVFVELQHQPFTTIVECNFKSLEKVVQQYFVINLQFAHSFRASDVILPTGAETWL